MMILKMLFRINIIASFLMCVTICQVAIAQSINYKTLHSGDLIFQDLDCPLCEAIEQVTHSYKNFHFSHIGIVYIQNDSISVIEAIGNKVQLTPLYIFEKRTNKAMLVGRLKKMHQKLIPKTMSFLIQQLGVQYDEEFVYNNGKYYCSELIYDAFKYANNENSFFHLKPMTFYIPHTNKYDPIWLEYYKNIGKSIPQGMLGINPGGISKSNKIKMFNYTIL